MPFKHPFVEQTWKEDLTLVVGDEHLYVSKTILAMYSKVFNARFEEGPIDTMELPGKSLEDVVKFLSCLYPNIGEQVYFANIRQVMPLALEFSCGKLVYECEAYLRRRASNGPFDDQMLELIDMCQTLKIEWSEKDFWFAIKQMNVSKMEDLEKKSANEKITEKIAAIKFEKLKKTVTDKERVIRELEMERKSFKTIVQYLMTVVDEEKRKKISIMMDAKPGKICASIGKGSKELEITRQSSNCDFDIEIENNESYVNVVLNRGEYQYAKKIAVMGAIRFNLLKMKKYPKLPFWGEFDGDLHGNGINIGLIQKHTLAPGCIIPLEGDVEVKFTYKIL